MIFIDFEVFKYDWMCYWMDTNLKQRGSIINDLKEFKKFYEDHKSTIWVGYNIREYDRYIAQALLCEFNPYDVSQFIITKDQKGYLYSKLLQNYPIIFYDAIVFGRSLKQLEGFMGSNIHESPVPFDIDRKLTADELIETEKYCKNDVEQTIEVFLENKNTFETMINLIKEFNLPMSYVSKTETQLSAIILEAYDLKRDDEFDITFPDNLIIQKNKDVIEYLKNWSENVRDYEKLKYSTLINGVPHIVAGGGIHGAINNYFGEGIFVLADVKSYYPSLMVEYDLLSRSVRNKQKYSDIKQKRLMLKEMKDPKADCYKLVLNKTYGGAKDKYNSLYDPKSANNVCIHGQLFLIDLCEKLEGNCELIQSNTDGICFKVKDQSQFDICKSICKEWEDRTKLELDFSIFHKLIQKDANHYICINTDTGKIKRKGGDLKELSLLDNNLPIVNKALVNKLLFDTPIKNTIEECDSLMDFQMIVRIGKSYDYVVHNGKRLSEKVLRVYASKKTTDTSLYKKHNTKTTLDKVANVPEHCFIYNHSVVGVKTPNFLDTEWYINYCERLYREYLGL